MSNISIQCPYIVIYATARYLMFLVIQWFGTKLYTHTYIYLHKTLNAQLQPCINVLSCDSNLEFQLYSCVCCLTMSPGQFLNFIASNLFFCYSLLYSYVRKIKIILHSNVGNICKLGQY